MYKEKSLPVQANPNKAHVVTKKSRRKKLAWRSKLFCFMFKLIEILGSLCGIIDFIRGFFKK